METAIFVLLLATLAFATPVRDLASPAVLTENDPDFKRYMYIENDGGGLDLVDLEAENITATAALNDVIYYLTTRSNKDQPHIIKNGDVSQLKSSPFNPSKLTMFITHGWHNDHGSDVNVLIKSAALDTHDLNVFVVDWNSISAKNYATAKSAVPDIGRFEGEFINNIMSTYGLSGSSFLLVGHSLGAHVTGCAGAILKSKVNIVGLDPAGPLYSISNTDNRLDANDGKFVQIIHTDGRLLGMANAIGDADYYPNGGMTQPGCGLDATGSCAHGRSYKYFAESIKRGAVFKAKLCDDYRTYEDGKCDSHTQTYMGNIELDKRSGTFYLQTNSEEPWAKN